MTKEQLAYLAGFFDGEGSLGVYKRSNKPGKHSYYLQVHLKQKATESVKDFFDQIVLHFGGKYIECKSAIGTPMFDWYCYADKATHFLEALLPYLVVKKEQANIALNWANNKIAFKRGENPDDATTSMKLKELKR